MAGAKDVRVWGRDTSYGMAEDIAADLRLLCQLADVEEPTAIRINKRVDADIAAANIVTNSGMLRPLDSAFLAHLDPNTSVVSLMYDAWELREGDIDLDECVRRGIKVVGTNESDSKFPIFDFCGPLIAKMIFEGGYEILENSFVVWSDDQFGSVVADYLKRMGAASVILTTDLGVAMANLIRADVIVFADYDQARELIGHGQDALFPLNSLKRINPFLGVIHLYGRIRAADVRAAGFSIYPARDGALSVMTETLAHLGSLPILKLTIAGLRAAQEVLREETARFSQPIQSLEVT